MRGRHIDSGGINLNQLSELAKVNPQYTQLYLGLQKIDTQIKEWVKEEIINSSNPDIYYIKTELMSQCFNIMLYNSERQVTVGVSWPLAEFLEMCSNKTIQSQVISSTLKMLIKFNEKKIKKDKIYWIY